MGIFLLAVWGLNYGVVAGLGIILGLYLQSRYNPGLWSPIWLWLLPVPVLSFLLARHAKSLFVAMDHYFDPHVTQVHDQEDDATIPGKRLRALLTPFSRPLSFYIDLESGMLTAGFRPRREKASHVSVVTLHG
jgi:hypothetical protein